MSSKADSPKVFISYSWSSSQHEAFVMELAEKLMADGVQVILDKWDLREGHDKYVFMETMVKGVATAGCNLTIDCSILTDFIPKLFPSIRAF